MLNKIDANSAQRYDPNRRQAELPSGPNVSVAPYMRNSSALRCAWRLSNLLCVAVWTLILTNCTRTTDEHAYPGKRLVASPVETSQVAELYAHEWKLRDYRRGVAKPSLTVDEVSAGLVQLDSFSTNGVEIVVAAQGRTNICFKRLLYKTRTVPFSEIDVGDDGSLATRAEIVLYGDEPCVLVEVENQLSDRRGLLLFNVASNAMRTMGDGCLLSVSPNRKVVHFTRFARKKYDPFHVLYLWRVGDEPPYPFFSGWEADPGSGRDWSIRWSSDSQALFLCGFMKGTLRERLEPWSEFDVMYLIDEDAFYGSFHERERKEQQRKIGECRQDSR